MTLERTDNPSQINAQFGTDLPEGGQSRRLAYTVIGEVIRNPDGTGSYCVTLHYRNRSVEVQRVMVAADGSAQVYNGAGMLLEEYPAGTTVVPPDDVVNRMGFITAVGESARQPKPGPDDQPDTAEAWPY